MLGDIKIIYLKKGPGPGWCHLMPGLSCFCCNVVYIDAILALKASSDCAGWLHYTNYII